MPFRTSLVAAVLAGVFATSPALAQSASASVDITGFSYQLIDLDLTDSITPSITFTELMVSTSHYDPSTGVIDYQQIESFGSTAMSREFGQASTTSSATASSANASFSLSSPYFQLFSGQNYHGWDFELSPATGILITTSTKLAAEQSGGSYALAAARMFGYLTHFGDEDLEQSDFNDVVAISNGTRSYALSGYLHSGAKSVKGTFGISNEATAAFYGVSPVPEPSSYAMLLAGLGLLGWRARRRQG